MGTLGRSNVLEAPVVYIKGAPEIVLEQSTHILTEAGVIPLDDEGRLNIEDHLRGFQRRGMRTLAFSYKPVIHENGLKVEQLAQEMIWLGYIAIADPIRPEVPTAVQACRDAESASKSSPATIRDGQGNRPPDRSVGFGDDENPNAHMTGREFAALEGEALSNAVRSLKVLSRARPMDKTRLVTTLQGNGEVVADTGDGTTTPRRSTTPTSAWRWGRVPTSPRGQRHRFTGRLVPRIVNAVNVGRSLYQNIQRFILFQLTINVAALGIALRAVHRRRVPLTVIQMLWVNLIMDTFASLALATEPARWDVMKRPPRKSTDFIITPDMARRILGFGLTFIVVLVGFLLAIGGDAHATQYELSLFYATFILLQFWNLFNARVLGLDMSAFKNLGENRLFLIIAAAIAIARSSSSSLAAIFSHRAALAARLVAVFALTSRCCCCPNSCATPQPARPQRRVSRVSGSRCRVPGSRRESAPRHLAFREYLSCTKIARGRISVRPVSDTS